MKTKALISFAVTGNREADLRLCFRICEPGFLITRLIYLEGNISKMSDFEVFSLMDI